MSDQIKIAIRLLKATRNRSAWLLISRAKYLGYAITQSSSQMLSQNKSCWLLYTSDTGILSYMRLLLSDSVFFWNVDHMEETKTLENQLST